MDDEPADTGEIKQTDIVFDCPYCGKSLAIDYHGAGLTVPCTDCGKDVEVPIPEGMEVTDIDSTDEEQEMKILNLRRSLAESEYRVAQLDSKLKDIASGREATEKLRATDETRFKAILDRLPLVEQALEEVAKGLKGIADLARGL